MWDSVTCDSMLRRYLWTKGNDCSFYELKNIGNFSLSKGEDDNKTFVSLSRTKSICLHSSLSLNVNDLVFSFSLETIFYGLTHFTLLTTIKTIFAAARQAMESAVRCIFGAEVANASWLYFLHYCNAAGGLDPIITADSDNSGQEYKIKVALYYFKCYSILSAIPELLSLDQM